MSSEVISDFPAAEPLFKLIQKIAVVPNGFFLPELTLW
jgi:hypothetical protein